MLYSHKNQYPTTLPFRIVLSDGRTRTDPATFTLEEIADAGYVAVNDPPTPLDNQTLQWTGIDWILIDKPENLILQEEQNKIFNQWFNIRQHRDQMIRDVEWRYNRYHRQVRLGLPTTDKIEDLDNYIQALADITQQPDPFNIVWPPILDANTFAQIVEA